MSVEAVLLPLFAQIALTFVLLFWMGYVRVRAIRQGEVRAKEIALGEPNWPPRVLQIANSFHNQLQIPVLFYVLTILALGARKADLVYVVMAWIFVALRVFHAVIHTTTNEVARRFYAFLAGAIVLAVMWAIFAVRIVVSPVTE